LSSTARSPLYVNYFDEINDAKVKVVMALLADVMAKQRPDQLYCLFSSPGGGVEAGIALYNFLRALPVEIVMHNTGNIDSIANVVFLSASTRLAAVHSSFMFHGVNWNFAANTGMNRGQLAETVSGLDASEAKIRGIIADRTTLTAEEIKSLFAQGETKSSEWALGKGIISAVKDPVIPKGAPFVSLNVT
jgi:ATP-dependent Clp protease, protease subunit